MRWVKIDGGAVLSDETKPFGYRTQGGIYRCVTFGTNDVKWLAKVSNPQVKQLFDNAEDAAKWVEVVVGLR